MKTALHARLQRLEVARAGPAVAGQGLAVLLHAHCAATFVQAVADILADAGALPADGLVGLLREHGARGSSTNSATTKKEE